MHKQTVPKTKSQVALGSSLVLQVAPEPSPLRDAISFYFAFRTLANGCAMAGSFRVESVEAPGTQVLCAPLGINIQYADFALQKASGQGGGAAAQTAWLEHRDSETRAKMVEHGRLGHPQGEALKRALKETELLWLRSLVPGDLLLKLPPRLALLRNAVARSGPLLH